MKIGSFSIGSEHPPFIIAELSGNHNQSIEKAIRIIHLAAKNGAHAVKLQTYTADSLTIDSDRNDFLIQDSKSLWAGRKLYELYQEACTPYEWHQALFEECKKLGLLCFSTPFDEAAVDFLEKFDPPCYKIASFENNHFQLIRKVAKLGKPIIISLGLSSYEQIQELALFLKKEGVKDAVLLKCTSTYPATPETTNLQTIPFLREKLNMEIGLSDHTMGIGVAIASIALGARVIEKHFTDSRSDGGVDSAFSIEPEELKLLVDESKKAWEGLGKISFELSIEEKKSIQFKRSIYVVKDIQMGERFTLENIRVIRPGFGADPKYLETILGKKASQSLVRGQALSLDFVLE